MRLGLIGTGMIGGSIGLAAREQGDTVLGCDSDPAAAAAAVGCGAVEGILTRDELYASCDVVVLASHLNATLAEVGELHRRALRAGVLVLDVASVKECVAERARGTSAFVPTHPMAGSERRGASAARADLFAGRTWCYVPTDDASRTAAARAFIERLGARAVPVDARVHDRVVALTSHLPQLFAYAFTRCIGEIEGVDPRTVGALCGPAARELLRLGRSSPQMWDEIFAANHDALEAACARIEEALHDRRLPR